MLKSWREFGSTLVRGGRRVFPVVVSVGLVTWLVWSITPGRLAAALSASTWPWLVAATAVQMVVLFLWDTVNLWWLFTQPDRRLPFRTLFWARTDSVLWSALNLEIGQGVFAWKVARAQGTSVSAALRRCLLLAWFDFGTLQALALFGSFLKPDPLLSRLRWVCAGILAGLLVLGIAAWLLPAPWRRRLADWDWTGWLRWWGWRHTFLLEVQRLILFLLVLLYAGVGLAICRLPADLRTVFGIIPFVLIAESLPGTGGLGERETALVYLLHPGGDRRAELLAFGLIWSTVVILGRLLIGLASWWLHPGDGRPERCPHKPEAPAKGMPPQA